MSYNKLKMLERLRVLKVVKKQNSYIFSNLKFSSKINIATVYNELLNDLDYIYICFQNAFFFHVHQL